MKTNGFWIGMFAGLILICVSLILWRSAQADGVAEIRLNGELVQTVRWRELKEKITIPVGDGNVVAADATGVWMEHADCPDQLCVRQGKIQSGQLSIVCLPNRVTVTLRKEDGEIDGVSG